MTDVVLIEIDDDLEVFAADDDLELYTQADSTITVVVTTNVAQPFIKLSDTPQSYVGQGGKVVRVKLDETGLEFFDVADNGISGVSLAALAAPGNGTTIDFGGVVRTSHSLQVEFTGGATGLQVALQLFVFDWFTVATWDLADGRVTSGILNANNLPALKARAVLVTLTGGTAPTVTASIASK